MTASPATEQTDCVNAASTGCRSRKQKADGHWRGWIGLSVDARALWRLGLHPDQASSVVDGPSPPAWWHAAGLRYATAGRVAPGSRRFGTGSSHQAEATERTAPTAMPSRRVGSRDAAFWPK